MSESKISIVAEVATAIAAVTYPILRVGVQLVERRQVRRQRLYAAPAAAVEARMSERWTVLEERLAHIERDIEKKRAA
jgi:hypothetical protein